MNWKESSKNGKKWKSQDFMVPFKFLRSEIRSNNITDSVIFSIFSENYQKVRKLTIWFNQQKMEISTFWHEKNSFLALNIDYWITRSVIFFFFRFRVTWPGNRVRRKSSFRLCIRCCELWFVIWLVIYQNKAHKLQNSKTCISWFLFDLGRSNGHFLFEWSKWPFSR